MAAKSKIEHGQWWDVSWNPSDGCTKISEGCKYCWAEGMAMRFTGHFNVTLHPDRLDQPLHWKKPRRIFVCSMGDLFHEDVPFEFIRSVFLKMRECYQHTFLLLTKRPERVLEFDEWSEFGEGNDCLYSAWQKWIWLGVTAENQKTADERIPILLQIPAALHFVSVEPMLEHIDLMPNLKTKDALHIEWVIIGTESGAKRRFCRPETIADVVDQCEAANIPVFVKQIHDPDTGKLLKDPADWPEDLRIRQWPE